MKNFNLHLQKTAVLLLCCFGLSLSAFAQNTGSITGSVTGQNGDKLIGVNIILRGTDGGTVTDTDGNFTLQNLAPRTYTLDVSYIGYESLTRKVTVTDRQPTRVDLRLSNAATSLSEIYVKGAALKAENSTITVDVVTIDQIRQLNPDQPLRLVEQVAGVDLTAFRQGGVADQFSIRGFGGGGHGGEAGVEADGISLNEAEGHSDGYADLNVLIPLNLQKLKVYKGPSSVLFGRFAQGGTLALETRKGGEYQEASISGGAFNTLNAQYVFGKPIAVGKNGKTIDSNLAFQLFQTDGYSENSEVLRGTVNGRLAYNLTDKTDIAVSMRGHRSNWNAAGYISETQFNDPERRDLQDSDGENDGGEKSFYSQRIDLNHTFTPNLRLLLFGYAVQQDFTRFAKFGFSPGGQSERFNNREVYSAGGSLNGSKRLGNIGVDWLAGAEYYSEATDRFRWASSDRVRGDLQQDRTFTVQSFSAYAQGELAVSRFFRPSLGLRYDVFNGNFTVRDPGTEVTRNDMNDLSHVSPKLGVRSTLAPGFDLRASASNGFSLPNSTVKYDSDLPLDPIQLWQYEVGASYNYRTWLTLDVAGFLINSSQEVVENPPGSAILINAGSTRRQGIESTISVTPSENLKFTGTYSYIETEIVDNPDASLEGKGLTGVPSTIATFSTDYVSAIGLGGRFSLRDVGSYFAAVDNSASYGGYTLADLMLFYQFDGETENAGRIFIEIRNLFDEEYSETVFALGDTLAFAPAPLRNISVGVNYRF